MTFTSYADAVFAWMVPKIITASVYQVIIIFFLIFMTISHLFNGSGC